MSMSKVSFGLQLVQVVLKKLTNLIRLQPLTLLENTVHEFHVVERRLLPSSFANDLNCLFTEGLDKLRVLKNIVESLGD